MDQDQQDVYTSRQVASICKVTLRRVNKWLRDGELVGMYSKDGRAFLARETLRLFMLSKAMDLSRLPQAAEVTAAQRVAETQAAIVPPAVHAAMRRVAALEAYVRELRTKLFYRDAYKAVERLRVTDQERDAIEVENTAARRRWDVETDRQLSAIAGMK